MLMSAGRFRDVALVRVDPRAGGGGVPASIGTPALLTSLRAPRRPLGAPLPQWPIDGATRRSAPLLHLLHHWWCDTPPSSRRYVARAPRALGARQRDPPP